VVKGLTKVALYLKALDLQKRRSHVMVKVQDARDLILTLVLADTRIGLSEDFNPDQAIRAEHKALKSAVADVKKVITAAQSGAQSYEQVRERLDQLPNPPLIKEVLRLLGHKTPSVQSMAGPIDLDVGKLAVKDLASNRSHEVDVSVVGGYDEQALTVRVQVVALVDADERLFAADVQLKVRVHTDEHRVQVLLAQAAKQALRIKVALPRIPITLTAPGKADLVGDLVSLDAPEGSERNLFLKPDLLKQFSLGF
jgi:hypothetical protein